MKFLRNRNSGGESCYPYKANGKIIRVKINVLFPNFRRFILGVLGHLIYARKSLSLPISWRKKVGRLVRNLGRRKDTDTYHVRWFWWNFAKEFLFVILGELFCYR